MLKFRLLTAVLLVPFILGILFFTPPTGFFILTTIIILLATWEWSRLMDLSAYSHRILYLLVSMFIMSWLLFIPMRWIYLAAFAWWIIAAVLVKSYPLLSAVWSRGFIWRGLMGWLVLMPCWVGINTMRIQQEGAYGVLFLFVLIWGADTAAYFVGRQWGQAKLMPAVSPGKTWAGLFGALIAGMIIALAALQLSHAPFSIWPWAILLSLVTVIFSVLGDLFESMLKRQVGVKDSGNWLPGHGGILDRIDSLTAAVPVFVIGGLLLGKFLR